MKYEIRVKGYSGHPTFFKTYKRFKSAINYFDKLVEIAEHSISCGVKDYEYIKFYVNGNLTISWISWVDNKLKWHNRCPKCGNLATERTLRFCCY